MIVAPVSGQMVLNPIMACQDKLLRILSDTGDKVIYTQQFDAACNTISLATELSERQSPIIGYGLSNGEVGVIELMRMAAKPMWSLDP